MSIAIRDLKKAYGDTIVLDGFSLDVDEGEIVSVIGASGSGKSTMLKTVIGLIRPDAGDVWVDDAQVGALDTEALYQLRRKVGYVFQFAALFDSMTVGDNVAMGLRRVPDAREDEIRSRVSEALEQVELGGTEDLYPSELSGGMRKRAGVARAIAMHPRYLLYDEPTTGLDPVTATVIDRLILKMRSQLGVTSLVITHDLVSAYRISDRIAMLHEGRVRALGTPAEIRESADPTVRGFVEGRPELWEAAS